MEKEEFIATCLLLLYCLLTVANSHSGSYHAGNGIYCNKCPPGTYVNKNCTSKDPTPDCQPCELGKQFQPNWTDTTTCGPCRACYYYSRVEIKENCTTTANTVCQCEAGYYKTSETEDKFVCKKHTQCKPGEGLMRQGDRETNSICESCVNGSTYFETTQQPCQLCTNCSTELCAPFCLPANPVTTEKTAGLAGYAIALIVLAVVAAVIILVALIACYKKVPCWHEQSSNAASAPPEESRPLSNAIIVDETDRGTQRMGGLTTHVLKELAHDLISLNWAFFFRGLFSTGSDVDKEIDKVKIDFPLNVTEQIYQMLLTWKRIEGHKATLERIVIVLRQENMYVLVEKYQNFYPDPSHSNGSVLNCVANGDSRSMPPTAPPANDVDDEPGEDCQLVSDSNGQMNGAHFQNNGHVGTNGML